MKLTKIVTGSFSVLKDDIKNLFMIGERNTFGLIPVLDSKVAIYPLNLELNFTNLFKEVKI